MAGSLREHQSHSKMDAELTQSLQSSSEWLGSRIRRWYEVCGDQGIDVQRSMVRSMLRAKSRHQLHRELEGQASSSTHPPLPEFEPSYTALVAGFQGGKSYAQGFTTCFPRPQVVTVHIALNPVSAHQFTTDKLTSYLAGLGRNVVEMGPGGVILESAGKQITSTLVVAATTARLTRLAAELYNHKVYCERHDCPYLVNVNIDEADYLFASKGKRQPGEWNDATQFRKCLYTILGRRRICVEAPQQKELGGFDGKQLSSPIQVFLTTATETDMLVQLETSLGITVEKIELPYHPDYLGHPEDIRLLDNILVSEVKEKATGYYAFADPRLYQLYDDAHLYSSTMILNVTNHRVTGPHQIYRTDAIMAARYPGMATVVIADDRILLHGPGITPDWTDKRRRDYDVFSEARLGDALSEAHRLAGSNPVHVLLNPQKGVRSLTFQVFQQDQIVRRLTHMVLKLGPGYSSHEHMQAGGRFCGNGRQWLHGIGMDKLAMMTVQGDFEDTCNYAAYRNEVDMRQDDRSLVDAYCGTRDDPLSEHVHQGIGAAEFGPRSRPVSPHSVKAAIDTAAQHFLKHVCLCRCNPV